MKRDDSRRQPTAELIGGKYRVESMLGRGGAAQVYRVTDVGRGLELALKRINAGASASASALFEREYQTLASLKHPRIIEVLDYGLDQGQAFYTMELLAGEELKDRAPLSWREACAYLRDAAQALALLHARGLLHRDVSPRNLWRTRDGRVKLIDFGALAPFGRCAQIVGTPPFVPPEAYHGQALDQRADLYALGAVAYYLLTGLHAFPARDVHELPALWTSAPPPPSQCVRALRRADLEDVPPELDVLVTSLLHPEPLARPSSADELIERIDALLGDLHPSRDEQAQSRLSNTAFIGRARERRNLGRQLRLADRRHGQSCLIEAESGMGSSRLLREHAIEAQVLPATVLHVDAMSDAGSYAVAEGLALALLSALPDVARAAAAPHAALLAQVSPALRERLGVQTTAPTPGAAELRVQMQAALRDWFLSVAAEHTLVVLVDGLERADEGSCAFLLALAQGLEGARLQLVCTLGRARGHRATLPERALQASSRRLVLGPLDAAETLALLGSIFGEAQHLAAFASRLGHAARGNPGYLLELTEQLVRRNVIGFVAGTWVLPREVPDALLSSSHAEALTTRLDFLSSEARELGRVLSVVSGPIAEPLAKELAASVSEPLYLRIGELLQEEVLVRSGGSLQFKHEPLRTALSAELRGEPRKHVLRTLGKYLLAHEDSAPLARLRAGLYLLESDDPRGGAIVAQESLRIALRREEQLREALPIFEAALALLDARKRPDRERIALLAPLSIAGYASNVRYAEQYGEQTLTILQRLVGLGLARRLRPIIGRKLGLMVALFVAGVGLGLRRRDPRVPTFRAAMQLLFGCVTALTGASILCMDGDRAAERAAVLEPFSALGPNHLAVFIYEYCRALSRAVRDCPAESHADFQPIIARLESAVPIPGMSEVLRRRFLAGALTSTGVIEGMRDDARALRTADRLDALGLHSLQMSADQVRTICYSNQGDYARFEAARRRVEQHAIQQGATALIETWTHSMLIGAYLRTQDVMGLKRVSEELRRVNRHLRTLAPVARRSRGAYLLLRGKYADALPLLEDCLTDKVRGRTGWGRMHGLVAHAYNRLGQHERAREVCVRAVSALDPDDRAYPPICLLQQTELLIAEAALGNVAGAQRELAALIAFHEPNRGPLTMGQLHEVGLEIARRAGDAQHVRDHLAEVERWYGLTDTPSLVQRSRALRKAVETADGSSSAASEARAALADDEVVSGADALTVDRLLAGGSMTLVERSRKALEVIARAAGAERAYLFVLDDSSEPRLTATLDDTEPDETLAQWVRRRLERELEDEMTQVSAADQTSQSDYDSCLHQGQYHRQCLLLAPGSQPHGVLGVVIVSSDEEPPRRCPADVLSAVSRHLQRAMQQEHAALAPG